MKLNEKPFYLSEKDIEWVKETLASMSVEEKIGQLFCLTDMITDEEQLKEMIRKYKPGGFMYRSGNALEIQNAQRVMQETSRIPPLLSCNWKAVETAWLIPEPSLADSFRWLQQMKKSRRKDWA
ncbi:MAG: hypothetical protein ACLVH3_00695 [Blautia obeum]